MCTVLFLSISSTAKSLVSCLMEVEQDQRLTAQEAISHEWYGSKIEIHTHFCLLKCFGGFSVYLSLVSGFLGMQPPTRTSGMECVGKLKRTLPKPSGRYSSFLSN